MGASAPRAPPALPWLRPLSSAAPRAPPSLSLWARLRSQPRPPWFHLVGAAGFVLVAVQWCMTDLLTLRAIAVLSSLSFIVYNLYAVRPPLWLPIQANVLFIGINLVQVARLLLASAELSLEPHEAALWEGLFHRHLSQRQTRQLLAAGTLSRADEGEALPHGRDAQGRLSLSILVDGFASVNVGAKPVATLGRTDFIGEMSFLDESLPVHAHAHVVALEPVAYVRWDGDELRAAFARDPSLEHALLAIWTQQLVRRLGRMDERARLRSRQTGNGEMARQLLARRETVLLPALEKLEMRGAFDQLALTLAALPEPPAAPPPRELPAEAEPSRADGAPAAAAAAGGRQP